jgi:hypothetical protein
MFCVVDWASNGQQLVVGNTDGVLTQYTIAGETVAQVLPPSDIEDKFGMQAAHVRVPSSTNSD